jgi:hypothetical protein
MSCVECAMEGVEIVPQVGAASRSWFAICAMGDLDGD